MNTKRNIYIAVALVGLLDCALPLLAPLAAAHGPTWLAQALYASYASLCHQRPDRSFFLQGFPLALCHRCAGIHFGLLIGLGWSLRLTRSGDPRLPGRAPLISASIPLALDIMLPWLGWYKNTVLSRVTTGMLLGGVLAFYLMPGLVSMVRLLYARRHRSQPWLGAGPSALHPASSPADGVGMMATHRNPDKKELSWTHKPWSNQP